MSKKYIAFIDDIPELGLKRSKLYFIRLEMSNNSFYGIENDEGDYLEISSDSELIEEIIFKDAK